MPPPKLKPELMVSDIGSTLLAGHMAAHGSRHQPYPQSHSDMTWAIIGLLQKYDVKLRPLPRTMEDLKEDA